MAKLALCFGTRPQLVKSAALIPRLRERWEVVTIDTGQHYDRELRDAIYDDLGLPVPDRYLGVGPADPVEQTARMAASATRALQEECPDGVVVIGDTNSTLACALAAQALELPIIHVEAGLRSGALEMAEERNRRAVDAISAVLCAPSRVAADTLHREGVAGSVTMTGDIARDVLAQALGHSRARARPRHDPYVLATLHRAELTDHPEHLADVLSAFRHVDLPIVLPLHPRTRSRIDALGLWTHLPSHVDVRPPMSYLDTVAAIRGASAVVTDSGGVQREAYWLGVPCVTVRAETEWTETLECGANRLVAPEHCARQLADAVREAAARTASWDRNAYGDGNAGARIADAIDAWLGSHVP